MADNEVGQLIGTVIRFIPAAATLAESAIFEIDGLGSGAGRQSAQFDFGTARHTNIFDWRAFAQFATAPVLGERIDIYLKTSDGTREDNDDGTGDLAVSAEDKLNNLHLIGSIIVDEAVADTEMVASGTVEIRSRYVQVVVWNASADALTTDVDENGVYLTPATVEIE